MDFINFNTEHESLANFTKHGINIVKTIKSAWKF